MKKDTIEKDIEKLNKLKDKILLKIFKKEILPIIKRFDWSIDWAMGSVSFVDKYNNEKHNITIRNIEKIIGDYLYKIGLYDNKNSSLWILFATLYGNGSFHHKQGFKSYEERYYK